MKILVFSGFMICSFILFAKGQFGQAPYGLVQIQDTSKQFSLSLVLSLYYDLKNALVNSDAPAASAKAGSLLNTINGLDRKALTEEERKIFTSLLSKLNDNLRHIAEAQKIDQQREHFANLSLDMYLLAKAVRLSNRPVYQEYCPMKKAYWLSAESEIKNPYFGNQMISCGSVTNTIQ